jgi:hypothetical protein
MLLKVNVLEAPVPEIVAIDSNEGGSTGVIELEAADAIDVPFALVAVTVNV